MHDPPVDKNGRPVTVRMTFLARFAWLSLLLCVAVLLLVPLPNDYRALWFGAATDFLHVPIFAALTLALVQFGWLLLRHSLLLAGSFSVAAELLQPFVGRSASWRDLAYGLIGIAIASSLLQRHWHLTIRMGLALVFALWPLARTLPVTVDAYQAWKSFPNLASFEGPFSDRRWLLTDAVLRPSGEQAVLILEPRKRTGAGAILLPVVRDWTAYERLEVEFSFEGEPLPFLISVRDGKKLPPELPRFDLWRRYDSGSHHVSIDLRDLERGANYPPIELHRVQSLHLVGFDDEPRTILLKSITLTGKRSAK